MVFQHSCTFVCALDLCPWMVEKLSFLLMMLGLNITCSLNEEVLNFLNFLQCMYMYNVYLYTVCDLWPWSPDGGVSSRGWGLQDRDLRGRLWHRCSPSAVPFSQLVHIWLFWRHVILEILQEKVKYPYTHWSTLYFYTARLFTEIWHLIDNQSPPKKWEMPKNSKVLPDDLWVVPWWPGCHLESVPDPDPSSWLLLHLARPADHPRWRCCVSSSVDPLLTLCHVAYTWLSPIT